MLEAVDVEGPVDVVTVLLCVDTETMGISVVAFNNSSSHSATGSPGIGEEAQSNHDSLDVDSGVNLSNPADAKNNSFSISDILECSEKVKFIIWYDVVKKVSFIGTSVSQTRSLIRYDLGIGLCQVCFSVFR